MTNQTISKGIDSLYEAGRRSGAWMKYRVNLGQEFVIGGYAGTFRDLGVLIP
jgi:ATP-dependent DNA ligase